MMKMKLEYAETLLSGGTAFGTRKHSVNNSLLVVEDDSGDYYGTELKCRKLQVDAKGYVVFTSVRPIIDADTRFQLC